MLKMREKIKKQLRLKPPKLYCQHDVEKPCEACMTGIRGNVGEIYGNVSGIYGDVSGIIGDVSGIRATTDEIRGILMTEK